MSKGKKTVVDVRSIGDEVDVHVENIDTQKAYRENIAHSTQDIVDKLDQQKLKDIELELMRKAAREELENSIRKLDNHAICQEVHEEDCNCSKCRPSPKPNFLRKHKAKILAIILFVCMLILSIGCPPSRENNEVSRVVDIIFDILSDTEHNGGYDFIMELLK